MSADDWESENFEPVVAVGPLPGNRWQGEDEEDEVKDSWENEDEEEEKKDSEKQPPSAEPQMKAVQVKKSKKSLSEKIQKREEEEAERQKFKEMTTEEKVAEKMRVQKLQEEADLQAAKEVFGVIDSLNTGVDVMNPATKEEFDAFQKALTDKVTHYAKSPHFPAFVENLVRNICVPLNPLQLKKIKTTVETLAFEKTKSEKAAQSKKAKGKVKAQLKLDDKDLLADDLSAYGGTEFEDFM